MTEKNFGQRWQQISSGFGAQPLLTWYSDEADRVELSGATLANHIIKAANFLLEEVGVAHTTTLEVRLTRHWLAPVWLSAGALVGAQVSLASSPQDAADFLVTSQSANPGGVPVTGDYLLLPNDPLGMASVQPSAPFTASDVRNMPDQYLGSITDSSSTRVLLNEEFAPWPDLLILSEKLSGQAEDRAQPTPVGVTDTDAWPTWLAMFGSGRPVVWAQASLPAATWQSEGVKDRVRVGLKTRLDFDENP